MSRNRRVICRCCGSTDTTFVGRMLATSKTWNEEKEVYFCGQCGQRTVKTIVEREPLSGQGTEKQEEVEIR